MTCDQCGHEASGAFCANCGASLRGSEDVTSTAGTHQSAPHREGWHDESTYTGGYSSFGSRSSTNPGQRSYSSSPYGSGAAPVAPSPGNSHRRSNQMLATLVGVAAIAVFALVAYLIFKPGSGGKSTNTAPSVNNSVASSSTSSPSTSTVTSQSNQPQPQQTVTETQTSQQAAPDNGGGNADGPNTVDGYTFQQSGDSVSITDSSGNSVGDLHLNGYRSDWGQGQKLNWTQLPGCSAPILVWNAGDGNSSGAFGQDSSGQYQLFQSTGTDLVPMNGNGSAANTYGVYIRKDHISYRDTKGVSSSKYHKFTGCGSDGRTLSFAGTGY